MIDIPMTTKQPCGLGDLVGQLGGGGIGNAQPQAPLNQQTQYQQPPVQQTTQNPFSEAPQDFGGQQSQNFGRQPAQDFSGQSQGFGQPSQNMGNQYGNSTPAQPYPNPTVKQRPAGNGVILKKGQKMSLQKLVPGGLTKIDVCLGWDVGNNTTYDLDSSCFLLGANDRIVGDDWFVFYNQPGSPDGAVTHHGDNRDGSGVGDDEVITVDLQRLNPSVNKLVFVISIDEAIERGYNFSQIKNAYFRIVDKMTGNEIVRHDLTDYYNTVTSMVTCEVYKHNGEWKVNTVGNGLQRDLLGLCEFYGVNVAG